MLFSAHAMLAAMTHIPEFEIDEAESKSLASASMRVAAHYNIMPDEKTQDWVNLVFVLCGVYGSRMMAYRIRMTRPKTAPTKQQGPNVIDMVPTATPAE